jgi:hypothetical protein
VLFMETQIKLFGSEAKSINKGDIFIPSFDSVEGHDVVILNKSNTLKNLLEMYDTSNIGLDGILKGLRGMVGNV